MVYTSARNSREHFCINTGVKPYPAQELPLGEWIAPRANRAAIALGNGPLKATTIETYLSYIRLVYVDSRLNTEVFSSSFLRRIIKGVRRCQPTTVKQTGALTALQVQKMTVPSSSALDIDNVYFNAAAKAAFSGFLRSGEFTYSKADVGKDSFQSTNLTRANVTFANDDKYAILPLKRSKTDYRHRGVDIHPALSKGPLCPVVVLRKLFTYDPQPPSSPLFRMEKKIFFPHGLDIFNQSTASYWDLILWTQLPSWSSPTRERQLHNPLDVGHQKHSGCISTRVRNSALR
ncbi:hypothetical protein DL95DRAFT_461631 [Leptodontidium sp. 2 PMI_412]|nr:hypothetical protein DL95DRAFT_461631 [Leptodontidium sp. 2 PMI_412]